MYFKNDINNLSLEILIHLSVMAIFIKFNEVCKYLQSNSILINSAISCNNFNIKVVIET